MQTENETFINLTTGNFGQPVKTESYQPKLQGKTLSIHLR